MFNKTFVFAALALTMAGCSGENQQTAETEQSSGSNEDIFLAPTDIGYEHIFKCSAEAEQLDGGQVTLISMSDSAALDRTGVSARAVRERVPTSQFVYRLRWCQHIENGEPKDFVQLAFVSER